ncbi:MAG: hypothetical protein M0R80_07990 [Proteobacteria bacterium]|jgi:hypothetical protein|nr:hypothetical protein [Pseudomonadota bacterium]
MGYAGADWIAAQGKTMSSFGRNVADLLGWLYKGIYHLPVNALLKTNWEDEWCIVVKLGREAALATTDWNTLTYLVFLCHKMAIRCEIVPCNMQKLALHFHRRKRDGDMAEKHPTLAEAVKSFEENCELPDYE